MENDIRCVKKRYSTRKEAKKELKKIIRKSKKDKKPTDVYYCDDCQQWHLTSMIKTLHRKYNHMKTNLV